MSKPYSSNTHSLEYLLQNNRPILNDQQFLDTHLIYRGKTDNNPMDLAYPQNTITALSCNWSKFIVAGDSLRLRPRDNFIFFTDVKKLKDFKIEVKKNDGTGYDGEHVLTCILYHSPLDNNYSHVQIDIQHKVKCDNPQLDEIRRYTSKNWGKGINLFKKKKNEDVIRFFKNLLEEYKFQLAQRFDELLVSEHFLFDDDFINDNPSFVVNKQPSTVMAQSSTSLKPVLVPQRIASSPQSSKRINGFWDLLKVVQESSSTLKSKLINGIANIFRKK